MAFTVKKIESLKPQAKRYDVFDGRIEGFGCRVSPTGNKSYFLVQQSGGKRRRYTIGRVGQLSLEAARARAIEWRTLVRNGKSPVAERQKAQRTPASTFKEVAEKYIAVRCGDMKRGKEIEALIRNRLIPGFKEWDVADIQAVDVSEFVQKLDRDLEGRSRGGRAASTKALERLKAIFAWATASGYVTANVCASVSPLKYAKDRDRVLSDNEIKAVWKASFELGYPYGHFFRLALITGQRRNEVASMKWADINDANIWTIPETKSGRPHVLPLPALAIELLNDIPRHQNAQYVFTTTAGRLGADGKPRSDKPIAGFSKAKKTLDEISGVTDWRLHDLRRTMRTRLSGLQVSMEVAERVLNHAPRGLLKVYDQYDYRKEKRDALARWAGYAAVVEAEEGDDPLPLSLTALVSEIPAENVVTLRQPSEGSRI